ncbi:hypothetical protein [Dyadobacter diqingensis]|uniref:hypothetical protein n=1 Tax=Dyadobacter diqingensis TaxID=2938121 RepID=UPI0020C1902B|nr:hypothetical protein [Dyadobacter diqingensis]
MKRTQILLSISFLYFLVSQTTIFAQTAKINRQALVKRHNVIISKVDTLASLSVGNGAFTFTTDITGLQTFPDVYARGVPLGTQSEWGWHRYPNTENYKIEESIKEYEANGRKIPYAIQLPASSPERSRKVVNFLRQNPHRLQLGNLGFELTKKDGTPATISDITNISQQLDLWTGEIKSKFLLEGLPVEVITYGHADKDAIAVKVNSALLKTGQIKFRVHFPYPTNEFADAGNNWKTPEKHNSKIVIQNTAGSTLQHQLDSTNYFVRLGWKTAGSITEKEPHYFVIAPEPQTTNTFELSAEFIAQNTTEKPIDFIATQTSSIGHWQKFWLSGGAIDFQGSTDPRAAELERRLILSQYLTRIQCAGSMPPQETGLTYNSWYGKPHLEMHWWHGVHYALWGRIDLLEKSLNWYARVENEARIIAKRQGFEGVRWQKMTDPEGKEAPSNVGAFLIWQQPHFIYFAELCYRDRKNKATIEKYKNLVFATADFMASYAYLDPKTGRYILGKGLIPAQERFKPEDTFNPTFELAYWRWALTTAQEWRVRSRLSRNEKWDDVLNKLAPLPQANGIYLAAESAPDSYTNPIYLTDHPAVLCALGMLPVTKGLNIPMMQKTFDKIWDVWQWHDTWGWDFPMVAMTATRLNRPDKAMDALMMDIKTNTYLPNGHNYQDERLRIYLPGNGGILAAAAMMCAGFDHAGNITPGIPKDGKWKVRWEGLKPMP